MAFTPPAGMSPDALRAAVSSVSVGTSQLNLQPSFGTNGGAAVVSGAGRGAMVTSPKYVS